jgi:two-component system, cell cycle sensor histidine kinase and response regulator CckA
MMKKLFKLIRGYFLFTSPEAENDPELSRDLSSFRIMSIFGIAFLGIFGISAFYRNDKTVGILCIVVSVALTINQSYTSISRNNKPNITIGLLFIYLIFLYLFITGRPTQSVILWYFILPILFFFFQGSRRGLICTILSILPPAVLFLHPHPEPHFANYPTDVKLRFLMSFSIIATFIYFIERAREKGLKSLNNAWANLEKRVEDRTQKLKESEDRYKNYVEKSFAGVYVVQNGLFMFLNYNAASFSAYKPEELIGRQSDSIVHPEDRCIVREKAKKMLRGEDQSPYEFRIVTKNGQIRWIMETVTSIQYDGRKAILGNSMDITDRQRAEEALRASQELEKGILLSVPHALFGVEERHIFFANDAMEAVFGWNPEELIGKSTRVIFRNDKEWEEYGAMLYSQLRIQSVFVYESDIPFVRKDGREIFCRMSVSRTGKELGESRRIVATFEDITERRRAEEALRETQRRLTDIIEFLPDATLVIDRDGKVIAWNRAIESMTGVKAEAMLGKGNYEYALPFYRERRPILIDLALHTDLERETAYTTIHRTGDTIIGEAYAPALTPGNVHLSATASVLRDSRGEVIAAIECIRNNTDRKSMEERLQRGEKMESLGVLAGGVAHDMNNVLGVLVGYSELLLREVPEGSRAGKYAKSILQGGERAAAIIQDLLTMARRGVSVSETVYLNRIVSDFLKSPEFELINLHHPDVLFRSQFETGLFNIKGSPVHLYKTIMNLLSNAAESISGAGEVSITTENRYVDVPIPGYENTQEGEYVVLTVSDTGSGISPADLERIFEPFYTKKVMGRSGTGLGLAVVWGTVKDHGGYIDVRSEENKGSTFTLYFPASREALSKRDQDLFPDSYQGRGESILVVDDIEEQRLLAATILEDLNYRVATAASGKDAVEYLRANKADLIVLDMIMEPGIDGLETYRRILEIQPRQKAIIVSGFAKTDRVGAAQELGAGEYVKKPYVIGKLGIAVRKELDRK